MRVWLRRAALGVCAALALGAALVAAGYAYLQTEGGRQRVTDEIFRALTNVDDVDVRIEGLAGSIPFAPEASRLLIADASGPWLEIVDTGFRVAALPLLSGRIEIEYLRAARVRWLRVPEFSTDDDEALPRYPFVVDAERVRIDEVQLSPGVAREIGLGWSALSLEGRGTVDLFLQRMVTEWSMTAREISAAGARFALEDFESRFDVGGSFDEPAVQADVVAENVVFEEYSGRRIEMDGHAKFSDDDSGLAVSAQAHATGVRTPKALSGLVADRLNARVQALMSLESGAMNFEVIELESAPARIKTKLTRAADGAIEIQGFSGEVEDVVSAVSGAGADSEMSGRVTGELKLAAGGMLSARALIRTNGAPPAIPIVQALLGSEAEVELHASGDVADGLNFQLERLHSALVRGSGELDLRTADAAMNGSFDVRIDDVETLPAGDFEMAGDILARIGISGTPDGFAVDATLQPDELRIGEYPVTDGRVVTFVDGLPDAARGSLEFELSSGDLTVTGRSSGNVESDGRWAVDDFDLSGASSRITGRVSGASFEPPFAGHVEARIDDARRWAGIVGVHLIGSADAKASFSANDGRQQLSLRMSATNAEAFLPDLPDFEAASLTVVAEVEDWSARRISQLDLQGTDCALGRVRFDTLDLVGGVSGKDGTVSLNAAGNYLKQFAVRAKAEVDCVECAERTIRVGSFQGAWDDVPIALTAPVEVLFEGPDFDVRALDVTFGRGRLRGNWRSSPWPGRGTVTAVDVPVELATIVSPSFPFTGTMNAEIRSDSDGGNPAAFDVTLRGIRLADAGARDLKPVDFHSQGTIESGLVRFTARMTAEDDADVRAEGAIPLVAERFDFDRAGAFRASAHGDVQSGFLGGLFLPPSERIRGVLDVELNADGTLERPGLRGRVHSESMEFTSGVSGLHLRGAAFEAYAHGSSLELRRFEARDRQGGSVVAEGKATVSQADARPEYALNARLTNLRLVDLDDLTVVAGGNVDVSGRGTDVKLSGRLVAASADLRLPERLPPEVVVIDVTHVNRGDDSHQATVAADVPIPVELDLVFDFPGRVTVHAPGLISEWRGDVKVAGTTEDPKVAGELRLIRGTIATAGLRFRMTEGRFVIDDELPVPDLHLLAESTRNNVTAIAKVDGPANNPTFELRSNPPLPEDEILSRLLFGTTPGRLTAVQSVQLAQAVARFSGLSSGNDPLYKIQRATGIDRVEIKGGEGDEGASISLGKYLTDRVFVSIDQGLTEQDSTARVEVDLTDNLSAQTEVGQDSTAGVGVQWRITY